MDNEFNIIVTKYLAAHIALPDQWWDDKKVEFIYNSNKLEGNNLKLADTYSIVKDKMHFTSEARFKDILEVKGHIKAVDTTIFMAKNNYPITEKTIQLINENLLSALWKFDEYYASYKQHQQRLGEYKTINNSIKYTLDGNNGIIEPTSNSNTVANNMKEVFLFKKTLQPLLERCAYLAYQLWINQPFPDGNKRTARLCVAYELMSAGLPLISFKAEGYHFNEGLLRSHNQNSLNPIMQVISTEVKQQLTELIELDAKLKINKTPPKLGADNSFLT
jgi:Fic family protein